jgi:hypothetical protein
MNLIHEHFLEKCILFKENLRIRIRRPMNADAAKCCLDPDLALPEGVVGGV